MICQATLYQQRYQTDKRKQDCYICGSYKKRTMDCTSHFIRTDHLTAGVTENIRKITSYAAKHKARFRKLLIEQNEDGGKKKTAARRKELEAAEKRITELSAIFKRLYEDSVAGRITDERFMELSADYEAEQKQLKDRAAELEAELSKAQEATANADRFLNIIHRYMGFEELTHTLLREFVEKIVIHECYCDDNGIRRQDVDIYYNFVGKVDFAGVTPELSGAMRKRRMGTAKIFTLSTLLYQTRANGHGSKRHMGKSVAYERKALQHMPSSGMMIQSHC